MKRVSNYLKMRVLGSLEFAEGSSMEARYKAVSQLCFQDEDGCAHQFTWRTIQTWWYYYRRHGITEAPERLDKGTTRKVTPEELLEAIEKVLPLFHGKKHNIAQVYRACIEKGHLTTSQIAPNTFRRHVQKYELLKPTQDVHSKTRLAFAKAHANDMWQADTLHGPSLRFNGVSTRTFLICFIDDASRTVPHGQFYTADTTLNLLDCFQVALFKRGVPQAMYVDNGSNYSAKEFALVAARLGTILVHTPVRDGAAKGKIERFFRTVRDQFLVRNLEAIESLAELNTELIHWLEGSYHTREHSSLGMKPLDRFGIDLDRIRYLHPTGFNQELFFLEVTRKVRIDNTFSLHNLRYEAPRDLRNQTITLRYDRHAPRANPIVYQDDQRLGEAQLLDPVANDRPPKPKNTPPQ